MSVVVNLKIITDNSQHVAIIGCMYTLYTLSLSVPCSCAVDPTSVDAIAFTVGGIYSIHNVRYLLPRRPPLSVILLCIIVGGIGRVCLSHVTVPCGMDSSGQWGEGVSG